MARGRTGDRLARTRGGLATCPGRETGPPRAGRAAPGPARRFRQPPPGGAPGPPRGRRSGPTRTRRRTRESELTGWQGPRKLPAAGPRPFPVAPAPPRARLGWWATRTGPGWGAGPAGGGPPPASYGGRAWPIPPAGPPPSELRRAIRRDRPGRSDLAGRRPARRDTPTPGRGTRVLPPAGSARWCPAAPSRPQPGTTNPSRKLSSLSKGSWCRRAAAGRAAGGAAQGPMRNTSPDRAPRTSHKLVARPAWRLATIHATKGGQWETAGGCKRALVRKVLLKGGLQPPHSADATTRLHDRRTGPDRRARPAAASDRRRRLDRERGGPGRGRAGAGAASLAAGDDPRGQGGAPGDRPGAANEPWKERSFQGRLAAPPGRSRAQSRSRTAWLPDPLRRGRGSPQRRPIPRNLRESGGLALHPRAFSGKESSHPLSGPRPGLVPGCRRGRARRTRSRPSTPCWSVPTTMAKKAAPKAAQGKAAPAPAAKAATAPAAKAARARPPPLRPPRPHPRPPTRRPPPDPSPPTGPWSTPRWPRRPGWARRRSPPSSPPWATLIAKELGKKGPGQFVVPGLLKLKVVRKPATKARPGTNPFTGEPMTIQAKPARNVVRALPLKALKEMV